MGRGGSCNHCAINHTPLWRAGPLEKPVLCNACGSRWRLRGNLNGYIPKHAIRGASSNNAHKLPSSLKNPVTITTRSSSSSSPSLQKTQGTEVQGNAWNPKSVTRKKRSNLKQQPSSLINTLQRQLQRTQQDLDDENTSGPEEEEILIHKKWQYIPDNEIGLGAMLLKPVTAP